MDEAKKENIEKDKEFQTDSSTSKNSCS